MRVLVACEFSGIVRDAFIRYGHDAISCDLERTEKPGPHIHGDIRTIPLSEFAKYDLMIAHPPCTHLAISGRRYFHLKADLQIEALEFVRWLMDLPIHSICIENPISIISTRIRPPDQYINPYEFGHGEFKKTSLWLKNLPPLVPTYIVRPYIERVHRLTGKDRGKNGSRTYHGIADAMARQWGNHEVPKTRRLLGYPSIEELTSSHITRLGPPIYPECVSV